MVVSDLRIVAAIISRMGINLLLSLPKHALDITRLSSSCDFGHVARRGNAAAVQWLLAHGADRHARNKRGRTAAERTRAHTGIVRLLTKS
jgi:hypothetical protein